MVSCLVLAKKTWTVGISPILSLTMNQLECVFVSVSMLVFLFVYVFVSVHANWELITDRNRNWNRKMEPSDGAHRMVMYGMGYSFLFVCDCCAGWWWCLCWCCCCSWHVICELQLEKAHTHKEGRKITNYGNPNKHTQLHRIFDSPKTVLSYVHLGGLRNFLIFFYDLICQRLGWIFTNLSSNVRCFIDKFQLRWHIRNYNAKVLDINVSFSSMIKLPLIFFLNIFQVRVYSLTYVKCFVGICVCVWLSGWLGTEMFACLYVMHVSVCGAECHWKLASCDWSLMYTRVGVFGPLALVVAVSCFGLNETSPFLDVYYIHMK